jgi:2-polyprenyl-3-methyl-5-hydroxy-6-metoxy-1,4-benzoquinol methylase
MTMANISEGFEEMYIRLRKSEGRLYSDQEVALLPEINRSHKHYKEWQIRKDSCQSILKFLDKHREIKKILEIGCGNGWLCKQLHKAGYYVTGSDINLTEIEQARRVFPEIEFVNKDVINSRSEQRYDLLIFAASMQYFENPESVIRFSLKNLLSENGVIIIADTFIYPENEIENAINRSQAYFKLNNSGMSTYYFHHSEKIFSGLAAEVIKPENTLRKKLLGIKNPFQIYIIRKKTQ